MQQVSFCLMAHNEVEVLPKTIQKIKNYLDRQAHLRYEILVVENGSTDGTKQYLKKLRDRKVRSILIKGKGAGLAMRSAVKNAKYNKIVLGSVDLPFNFSDFESALKVWDDNDFVFASKAHKKSIVYSTFKRKISTWIFRFLIRLFFNVAIKDTQGIPFVKKGKAGKILKYCDAKDAFFTAQLAIHGRRFGYKMVEVPVRMDRKNLNRRSKYNIVRDGGKMFWSVLKQWYKIRTEKWSKKIKLSL